MFLCSIKTTRAQIFRISAGLFGLRSGYIKFYPVSNTTSYKKFSKIGRTETDIKSNISGGIKRCETRIFFFFSYISDISYVFFLFY
jgi:hypothetical protein